MGPNTGHLSITDGVPSLSFRDPSGALLSLDGRIIRVVNQTGQADLSAFLSSQAAPQLLASGNVVGTRSLDAVQTAVLLRDPALRRIFESMPGAVLLEHERIPFPSFPYEWSAEMLHEAGALTLEVAQQLLSVGLGLKDATPYNILFRGPHPVFVDVLSFEKRADDDPTWLPYAQFVRTFLLPLLANRYFGLGPDQILLTRRDGLEPEEVYGWLSVGRRFRPPFLGLTSIPSWLASRHDLDDDSIYQRKSTGDPEKARFILGSVFKRLRRTLDSLAPEKQKKSTWSEYMSCKNYSEDQFAAKESFVRQSLEEFKPKRILDVGCNTGRFSMLAAKAGASVVAADYDPVVVGQLWRHARADHLNILPLVVNLTRPTPGVGWRNRECLSFLDRSRGVFDAVLMLAVIHHMLVTERIPLAEILALANELTTDMLIVEFIGPEDSMFRRITRGREHLHQGLTAELFEETAQKYFTLVRTQAIEGSNRRMYLFRKNG